MDNAASAFSEIKFLNCLHQCFDGKMSGLFMLIILEMSLFCILLAGNTKVISLLHRILRLEFTQLCQKTKTTSVHHDVQQRKRAENLRLQDR